MNHSARRLAVLACLFLAMLGCGTPPPAPGPAHEAEAPMPKTNRVDVPAAVRRNLGISFARAEQRLVEGTTRVPGRFEMLPQARQTYHARLGGSLELLVTQYARVEPGDVLFRIDAPAWRETQQALSDLVASIQHAQVGLRALGPRIEAVDGHRAGVLAQHDVWEARIQQLAGIGAAGGGVATARTEAQAQLAALRTTVAEIEEEIADLRAQRALLEAQLASHRTANPCLYAEALGEAARPGCVDIALARAATLLGVTAAALKEPVVIEGETRPRWRTLDRLEVRARQGGVVEHIDVSDGAWVELGSEVLAVADPARVRFRGSGLQADLARLTDGMTAHILPPGRAAAAAAASVPATVTLGLEADALTRRIDLIAAPTATTLPAWARAGVTTEMEVVLDSTGGTRLAIPLASVIQDGLERVIFRRDPKDADRVIRIEADLGLDDGHWVVVESGLMDGDEVVRDGIYELMLASSTGGAAKGGHFHADGTFHAEDH